MSEEQILDYKLDASLEKPFSLYKLAFLLIAMGSFIGGSTNLFNGWLSARYFRTVLRIEHFDGFWQILQIATAIGLAQGLVFGFVLSFIYTVGFASITKARGSWKFVKQQLKKMAILVYACWGIGGMIAIFLAFVFPDMYNQVIYGVPNETLARAAYAWVGGSIWGVVIGGIVAVFWGLRNTRTDWENIERHVYFS